MKIDYFEELELNIKHQEIKLPECFNFEVEKGLIIGRICLKITLPKELRRKIK